MKGFISWMKKRMYRATELCVQYVYTIFIPYQTPWYYISNSIFSIMTVLMTPLTVSLERSRWDIWIDLLFRQCRWINNIGSWDNLEGLGSNTTACDIKGCYEWDIFDMGKARSTCDTFEWPWGWKRWREVGESLQSSASTYDVSSLRLCLASFFLIYV